MTSILCATIRRPLTTGVADAHLHVHACGPRSHPPRPLPSSPPSGAAQDGSPLAEKPAVRPHRNRRADAPEPAHRATLPRRLPPRRTRRRPEAALSPARQRPRRACREPRSLLPGEPAPLDRRSPGRHPTTDGRSPWPDAGARVFKKTLGLSWRKVGTIPAKADPEQQAAFLGEKLRPRLNQAERGPRTVLFVDAAHFVYGPFLGFLWCLVRLFVPGPSGRKRYNVLAALDAISHRVIRVANHSYINAESVCQLLRRIAADGLPRPITLVLDNARYQRCEVVQSLARSLKIELLYLPSYSPNLNLIERLWKFVKKECLGCRVLPTYEAFTTAIDDCLANLNTRHKHQMNTLLNLECQLFDEDVPVLSA